MTRAALATQVLFICILTAARAQHRFTVSQVDTDGGPSARSGHLTVVLQSSDGFLVIVHGGRDAVGFKSDTWTYLVAQNSWRLLAAPVLSASAPPPPVSGAVGGYRFVDGIEAPFLYVVMGQLQSGNLTSEMWVMEFDNFTWARAKVDGDIPAPRFGAAGSLERFVKPDGTVEPALIISHGFGENGPLSDTYKCSFDPKDPYHATWRRLREPVGQYHTRAPHAMWMQASTFTASRDLAVFGGCFASERNGGVCPSQSVWLLNYVAEQTLSGEAGEEELVVPTEGPTDGEPFEPETDSVFWKRLPNGPGPRVGAAMAQGLKSFGSAYENSDGIAVLYSGLQKASDLPVDHVISGTEFSGEEIDILSTTSRTWLRERVHYEGPPELRSEVLAPRRGASLSIVRSRTGEEEEQGEPDDASNEFFLLFGGQLEDDSYTDALLKISFDAFVESEVIEAKARYMSGPFVHGILMSISWGVFMVGGAFSARYMKGKDGRPRYLMLHIAAQTMALILAWAGVAITIHGRRRIGASFAHARMGFALIILASMQPVFAAAGIFAELRNPPVLSIKPGHSPKSRPKLVPRLCKLYHSVGGLIIICWGCVNITLGLFLIMAPAVLWVQWVVYSCLLVIALLWLELSRKRGGPDVVQSRASSMNRMSRGNSQLRRVEGSFKRESIASTLRQSQSRLDPDGADSLDDDTFGSVGDVFPPGAGEIIPDDVEIPPDGLEIGSENNVSQDGGLILQESSALRRGQNAEDIGFEEPSINAPNSASRPFRERLESNLSSAYTYQDPDAY